MSNEKLYVLKNGYKIIKCECYECCDDCTVDSLLITIPIRQYYWCIYEPSGRLYMKCGSYNEAHELASHLIYNEC